MQKMYYSIREAAEITGLQAHVLRYWETEFKELKPKKNRAGNRIYKDNDIALIMEVKELLHDNRFTIEGARQEMKRRREEGTLGEEGGRKKVVEDMRRELNEILELLD